jgi:hypothetical protein
MPLNQLKRGAFIKEKVIQASQAMDNNPILKGTKAIA